MVGGQAPADDRSERVAPSATAMPIRNLCGSGMRGGRSRLSGLFQYRLQTSGRQRREG
jgi:hypothetical protein